jgi:hypothetical protein
MSIDILTKTFESDKWSDEYDSVVINEDLSFADYACCIGCLLCIRGYIRDGNVDSTKFYNLGKRIGSILSVHIESYMKLVQSKHDEDETMSLLIDVFATADTFNSLDELKQSTHFPYNDLELYSAEEYFIFLRSRLNYDLDSCRPLIGYIKPKYDIPVVDEFMKQALRKLSN